MSIEHLASKLVKLPNTAKELFVKMTNYFQLSESGVHRPPVSGIHGRDVEGAYSIVLSGQQVFIIIILI